jgi:hypothetical protein
MKTFIDIKKFNRRQYNKDKYYVLIIHLFPEEDRVYRIYLTGKNTPEFKNSFVCIPISEYRCGREHIEHMYLDSKVSELWHYWKAKTFRGIKIKIWDKLRGVSGFSHRVVSSLHEIDKFSDYNKLMTMISLCK